MSVSNVFIDSNVLLYLLSGDDDKANVAERVIQDGGIISVQVLNEITNVARRKLAMPWDEVDELIDTITALCAVEPLTVEVNQRGRKIAQRYGLSVYDAMIVASALLADCQTLFSEDMQDGLVVNEVLSISNPFLKKSS